MRSLGNLHPALRPFWHPVARSAEVVSDRSFATQLLGEHLVLVRDTAGEVHAFADACPRGGAPMSMEACERHGLVWVALEPPRRDIAGWPDGDDPTLSAFSPEAHTSAILAAYQADNLLDASHFGFLHPVLADRNPVIDRHVVDEQDDLGFRTSLRKLADDGESTEGWLRYTCSAPFTVLLRSEEPDGALRQSFFQAVQPIDEQRTRLFFLVRVPKVDDVTLAELLATEEQVQREDLWITSAQRRTGIDLSGEIDLHVRADRNGVLYRQVLRRMLGER